MFTARYGLIPYIKQITLSLKGQYATCALWNYIYIEVGFYAERQHFWNQFSFCRILNTSVSLSSRYCQVYPFRCHQLLHECPDLKLKHYISPAYCIYVFRMVLTLNSHLPTPHMAFTDWSLQWKHTMFSVRYSLSLYALYINRGLKRLTLRLLMSYIYIYIYIYIYMERLFLMFLDHTQRRCTVGRTPLDEWSAPTGGMDICLLWVSCVVR